MDAIVSEYDDNNLDVEELLTATIVKAIIVEGYMFYFLFVKSSNLKVVITFQSCMPASWHASVV